MTGTLRDLQIIRTRHPPEAYLQPLADLLQEAAAGLNVDDVRRRLGRSPESDRLFLALESEALIGYAQLRVRHDLLEEDTVELLSIVVAPSKRRLGVGTLLMTAAETWAQQAGRARLRVRADVVRTEALAFFAALGYAEASTCQEFTRDLRAARRADAPTRPA